MPPAPVIADVFRVAHRVREDVGGRETIFTRHWYAPGKTDADLAAAYIANFDGDALKLLSSGWAMQDLDITPLDGSSPATTFAFTGGAHGGQSGDEVFAYACVISQKTTQKGARGRGRMFIGPTTEDALHNSTFLTADATDVVTGWGNFDSAMQGDGFFPVIASYVHSDFHVITNIRCDIPPGIQRRRQHRLVG